MYDGADLVPSLYKRATDHVVSFNETLGSMHSDGRECQMLQAFVAARNSEKAMVVFEKVGTVKKTSRVVQTTA